MTATSTTTTIPAIAPYPLPGADELPASVPGWAVDPHRAVLLLHDMQEFFLRRFAPGASPRDPLVAHAVALRDAFARAGAPVAYTAQPGSMTPTQRGLLTDFWGPGMRAAPHERGIVGGLEPAPRDWLLTKWRYSAFARTDLATRLAEAGRDQIVLCGVYAHIGVLTTALDAFSRDVEVFVVADAVADFTREHHDLALAQAARSCAVVSTTDEVVCRIERGTDA